MGPTWGEVAPSWSQDGPEVGAWGVQVGSKLRPWPDRIGAFGRCCAGMVKAHYHSGEPAFGGLSRANTPPPAKAVPIAAKLC